MDDETFAKVTSDDPNSIRLRAKKIMLNNLSYLKMVVWVLLLMELVITITKYQSKRKNLKNLDTIAIWCLLIQHLDVAQQRNAMRKRKLPRKIVKDIWTDVQKNLGKFQGAFKKLCYSR